MIKIKSFWLLALIISLSISGCKTRKAVTKSNTQVAQSATADMRLKQVISSRTLHFGDSLKFNGFVPIAKQMVDSGAVEKPEIINGKSGGINTKTTLTPRRDNKGKLQGYDVTTEAAALPTSKTDTRQQSDLTENTKVSRDSSSTVKAITTTKLKPPAWVTYLLLGALALVVLLRTNLLNLIFKNGK